MKFSIIIPCFNEEKTIEEIIKRVSEASLTGIEKEIVVVDDGSTDKTFDILKQLKNKFEFKLLRHNGNKGKGVAIKTALKEISGDYVIIQDADLEYNPEDYKKLLSCVKENGAEVVYGSRYPGLGDKYSHLFFYMGGRVLTWITNLLYGAKITDEATCYKLFKREVIDGVNLKCQGFDFCPEITAKVLKKGITIHEVFIDYHPRDKGHGKKIKLKDGLICIWILIKYKFVD